MNKLQQIIAFLCIKYPRKQELSNARLTKLVYLSDWVSSVLTGEPMTQINWVFNHYGPYVDDVIISARSHSFFTISKDTNVYGAQKVLISYEGPHDEIRLLPAEKNILIAVIEKTSGMYFNEFVEYVYSTYPVKANERYSELNMSKLAREYKSQKDYLY